MSQSRPLKIFDFFLKGALMGFGINVALGFSLRALAQEPPPGKDQAPVNEYEEFQELEQLLTSEEFQEEYQRELEKTESPGMPSSMKGPGKGDLKIKPVRSGQKEVMIDVLELKDMDIIDVLKLIAQKSDLNIVAGQNVKGKVSIYLKDVEVTEALKIILDSNNLAYAQEDGIIRVMTEKDFELRYGYKFGENIQTEILQLKHVNAVDLLVVLNQMKSPSGKVIADVKSNTLVMMDAPLKIVDMERFIQGVDVPVATKVFNLNYVDAQEITEKIKEVLTVNVGRIKFDSRTNTLVVTDTETTIDEVAKIIQAFDVKHKEVLIEAKIIQVILSDQYKFGIDWEAISKNHHELNLKSSFSILTEGSKEGQVTIGVLDQDRYKILIEALQSIGEINTLSSPRITALNNTEARILIGSTQPYVTTTVTTPSTGPTTTAESVNFIEVGVKLYVTPTIHNDGFITMKIKPEVSSLGLALKTSQNNLIPVVETSEAETTVMVKDGITIIIGGLIKDEKITAVNKIPLLGSIPFLGAVFRNEDKQIKKTELVILLTPRIITGDVPSRNRLISLQKFR